MRPLTVFTLVALSTLISCKKWEDKPGPRDPSLDNRFYCNDPEAVNYNWGFPGKADSSTCIFPSDVFAGTYLFTDSVYNSDNSFDSAGSVTQYLLRIIPLSKSKLAVTGFCGTNDSLRFTAERSSYRANADTTIRLNDTTFAYGQFFCRSLDTLTGFFTGSLTDTTRLFVNFTVLSDTGVNFHRGTAIKQ